ncbi:hypothetical protein ACVDG3_18295 [Meridianimarinicoccus sp. RP-17]|uniref:hypothetical protein n=1 Tax=Meridianimarinicoccus zhengii TaxID=2056810 RepID=UPI000DAD3BAC|nr:hypothetical protein [Phycocomes zhengii]
MTQPIAASTIVQQAFRVLELAAPSSFGDESPQAAAASEQYPEALRMCLEQADWSFASELAELPAAVPGTDIVADPDLPNTFVLPATFVALRQMYVDGAWRVDRRFLRTDIAGPLKIRFTAMITDETQMPAWFRLAVSLRLATLLSPQWLGDVAKRDRIAQDAEISMRQALRHDARYASPKRWDGLDRQEDWALGARL